MIVEVCASSIASVKNAAQAGADRIELCRRSRSRRNYTFKRFNS